VRVSQNHFTTDCQSVLASSPTGTHDRIMVLVKTVAVFIVMGVLPVKRTGLYKKPILQAASNTKFYIRVRRLYRILRI